MGGGREEDAADYLSGRWWNSGDDGENVDVFCKKKGVRLHGFGQYFVSLWHKE